MLPIAVVPLAAILGSERALSGTIGFLGGHSCRLRDCGLVAHVWAGCLNRCAEDSHFPLVEPAQHAGVALTIVGWPGFACGGMEKAP